MLSTYPILQSLTCDPFRPLAPNHSCVVEAILAGRASPFGDSYALLESLVAGFERILGILTLTGFACTKYKDCIGKMIALANRLCSSCNRAPSYVSLAEKLWFILFFLSLASCVYV